MNNTLKLLKFETTDHLWLPALLYEPKDKTEEVAIFLHGNGHASGVASADKNNTLAQAFLKHNIAYFPFNNRGASYINKLKWYVNGEKKEFKCGTAYELIKDCIHDIDGAINFLKILGYKKFILVGDSTGSNKACVYNYYKQKNEIERFILLEGGDDTGLYYQQIGAKHFTRVLEKCREEIKKGNELKFVPKSIVSYLFSYQSLYDTINPDGDYNIFPYHLYLLYNKGDSQSRPYKKKLFREIKSINKKTLVVYGELDEYCSGATNAVDILKKEVAHLEKFSFKIVPGAEHGFGGMEKELADVIDQWV